MGKQKIPQSAREAYALLDKKLSKKDKAELLAADSTIDFHFGLGAWIRNNWIHPKDGITSKKLGWKSPYEFDLPDIPDLLSDKIIQGYIRHLKRLQKK